MTPQSLNPCHNRAPFRETVIAQVGWSPIYRDGFGAPIRSPVYVDINNAMTKDCQYSIGYGDDPKCTGCKWNQFQKDHCNG